MALSSCILFAAMRRTPGFVIDIGIIRREYGLSSHDARSMNGRRARLTVCTCASQMRLPSCVPP